MLLRDFDKREVVLIQKRTSKLDDRQEVVDKIREASDRLDQKKAELEVGARLVVFFVSF